MTRPLILITNDDGVHAKGLRSLTQAVKDLGDVIVCAPDQPQSGMSAAITVGRPIHFTRHPDADGVSVYSVSGTPVDCVKLALHAIVPRKPDLVLSGINHGSNAGTSVTYSGTMGAVLEGCMVRIPSVGFSLLDYSPDADFAPAMPALVDITRKVIASGLPAGVCLNVNMPAHVVPAGVRTCRAATGHWTEEYADYTDPLGRPFYWLTGRFVNDEPTATDTDEYWLSRHYISVVPTLPDQSALTAIPRLAPLFDR